MAYLEQYPWLEVPWQRICKVIKTNQLPQALMLVGPQGIGMEQFANALAQLILCKQQDKLTACQPCGECKACQLFSKHNHPDFNHIAPEADNKLIKVSSIKSLNNFMATTSLQASYKVCVISEAQAMNRFAANALLKTLEEPLVAKSLFILINYNDETMLGTIKSRCQKLSLPAPNLPQLKIWLKAQKIKISDSQLNKAHYLSQGLPLKVYDLLSNTKKPSKLQWYEALEEVYNSGNSNEVFAVSKQFSHLPLIELLDCLQLFILKMIKSNHSKPEFYYFLDELAQYKREAYTAVSLNIPLQIEALLIKLLQLKTNQRTHHAS